MLSQIGSISFGMYLQYETQTEFEKHFNSGIEDIHPVFRSTEIYGRIIYLLLNTIYLLSNQIFKIR